MQRSRLIGLTLVFLFTQAAIAEDGSSQTGLSLFDLSSNSPVINAGSADAFQPTSIQLQDGSSQVVSSGAQMLTAAQFVALTQVLQGTQTLTVSSGGAATGGSFVLNPHSENISGSLVIPAGVTVVRDFANTALSVSGTLSNAGTLVAFTSNPAVATASISAQTIVNSGLLTTIVPQNIVGLIGPSVPLSLELTASSIVNTGVISSSANLSATASSITNGAATLTALLAAVGAVNLQAASVANSGTVQSQTANVNIITSSIVNSAVVQALSADINISTLSESLVLSGHGGTLQALQSINIGNESCLGNPVPVTVRGGDLAATDINVYAPGAVANVAVKNIEGVLNITAGEAHVQSETQSLHLGNINLTGDPTFYNRLGDVVISTPLHFAGAALAILASGSVYTASGAGVIDTSAESGNAGDITIVAGANLAAFGPVAAENDMSSLLTVLGPNAGGPGSIDLDGANPISALSATSKNGNGGNITLVAFGGSIRLPGSVTIQSGGGGAGRNGDVTIIGGGGAGSTISAGTINTTGGTGGGGSVSVSAAVPYIVGGGDCAPCVNFKNGALLSGAFTVEERQFGFFLDPEIKPVLNSTPISLSSITTSGAAVTVQSDAEVITGPIVADGATKGGNVLFYFGGGKNFVIGNPTVSGVQGGISARGNSGGSITVKNYNGYTGASIVVEAANNVSVAATNGNGGGIVLSNPGGAIVLPSGVIDASAAGGGDFAGGTISVNGAESFPSGTIVLSGPLMLLADGAGSGSGGNIQLSSRTNLDLSASALSLSATGGSKGSSGGNGGSIGIKTFGGLTADAQAMHASPIGANGNGANYSLIDYASKIFVSGDLDGSGRGTGSGGSVFFIEADSTPFIVGPAAAGNGVRGSITVDSGLSGGNGGKLTIRNYSTGGVVFQSTPSILAAGGNGGELTASSYGQVTFAGGLLSVDASSIGSFGGGNIEITGSKIDSGGTNLHLSANGAETGPGGTISLRADSLGIGFGGTEISLSATGGSAGAAIGHGGKITVSTASGLLDIDPLAIQVGPSGVNGNGGILEFGTDSVAGIRVRGDLNASGKGNGNGGTVGFFLRSAPLFTVGAGPTASGVYGKIFAAGGNVSGNGTIRVEGYNLGLTIVDGSLDVTPVEGDGGNIGIVALNPWTINAQTISVDAHGNGSHNGGTISIVTLPTVIGGTLNLSANATGSGNGGKVSIAGPNVSIGHQPGEITISARGGSSGSNGGNGGAFSTCGGSCMVTIDPSAFDLSPAGTNGNGPTIQIGTRFAFYINGDLNASGVGTGSGGYISLNSDTPIIVGAGASATKSGVNGRIIADAGAAGGAGGQAILSTNGNRNITVEDPGAISVRATNGNGGVIVFSTMFGGVTLPAGILSVDAAGSGNFDGGGIGIFSGGVAITGGGNLSVSAAATGTGKPGTVSFENTGGPISIGTTNSIHVLAGGLSLRSRVGGISVADSVILSGALFELWAAGPVTLGNNVRIDSLAGILLVGSQVNIADNVSIRAGTFSPGAVPGETVFSSGAAANGSVWFHGGSGITIGNDVSITSIGEGGISFTGGGDVVTGNDISMRAYGGNISIATTGNINLDNGGELVSIAQLRPFGVNVLPDGYLISKYTGGAIGLFAGGTGNAPDLNLMSLQRSTDSVMLLPAGGLPSNNKLESSGGGWLQVVLPPQFQKSIANSTISSSGGFIYLDPPGDNLSLINMNILAVGPVPVAPGQQSGAKGGVVAIKPVSSVPLPSVSITSGSPVVPTDTVKKRDAREEENTEGDVEALVGQANVGYVTSGCQAFSLNEGDDSLIIGESGTSFSTGARSEEGGEVILSVRQSSRTVSLDSGKLIVSSGKEPVFVSTAMGTVTVPQATTAVIEQNKSHNVVRLKTIAGGESTLSTRESGGYKAGLGQELLLADADCDDEELIPTDGIDRTIEAQIRRSGRVKSQTARINLQQYFGVDPTLQCSSVRAFSRLKTRSQSQAPVSLRPIAAFAPSPVSKPAFTGLRLGTADIIHSAAARVSITDRPGTASGDKRRGTVSASMQTLKFDEGSIFVCAKRILQVDAGSVIVVLKKGAVSLINRHDGLVSIATLSDDRRGSVEVRTTGSAQRIPVEMGQELCVSANRQNVIDELNHAATGRRRTKITSNSDLHVCSSEVSLPSILQNHSLLLHMRSNRSYVRHVDTLLKAACVLHHATGSHGQFNAAKKFD